MDGDKLQRSKCIGDAEAAGEEGYTRRLRPCDANITTVAPSGQITQDQLLLSNEFRPRGEVENVNLSSTDKKSSVSAGRIKEDETGMSEINSQMLAASEAASAIHGSPKAGIYDAPAGETLLAAPIYKAARIKLRRNAIDLDFVDIDYKSLAESFNFLSSTSPAHP